MAKTWEEISEGRQDNFCFLKIDIVQHSQIALDNKDADVEEELDRFVEYVKHQIESEKGHVWSWQGDGGLCAFLTYDRSEVNHAVQCGISIIKGLIDFNRESQLQDDIQVRIAVHLGQAKWREDTGLIHSIDINFVSHLESSITPNSIAISNDVYRNCDSDIQKRFEPGGNFEGAAVHICKKYGQGLFRELNRIRKGVDLLIKKISGSGFEPDSVVGVGRSGGIIAAMIAGNMGITSCGVLSRSVRHNPERDVQPDDIVLLNVEKIRTENTKVLLVFVEIRGGSTYRAFRDMLRSASIDNFRVATLFISPRAQEDYPDVEYAYVEEFDLTKALWVIDEAVWKRV